MTNRPVPSLLLLGALIVALPSCRREAQAPQPAASQGRAHPKPKTPPATVRWAKLIVGTWVSSSGPPEGGPEDNCEVDTNFDFGADGSYGTSSSEGHWRLDGDMLVATTTAQNPDGDIGPPMKKLAKPYLVHSRLIAYKAPVLTTITEGQKEYWYRCPMGTDANP